MTSKLGTFNAFLVALVLAAGCGTDDEGTETATSVADDTSGGTTGGDTDGTGDTEPSGQCSDTNDEESFYEPPGECYNNAGCESCFCKTFRDNPPDGGASCELPSEVGIHITATVLEFPTSDPLADVTVKIVNAFDVGQYGPENAPAQAETVSGADARIELQMTPTDPIGIVAILDTEGFAKSATGLAPNPYEPANAIHDLFVVKQDLLDTWSAALMGDPDAAEHLPLGEAGGVVGFVRNRYTGDTMVGVQLRSLASGSETVVRYLNEDGTFNSEATTATGQYVLLAPQLAEQFEAVLDGQVVSTRPNKAGTGPGGVFIMNLTIDTDPGFDPFGD